MVQATCGPIELKGKGDAGGNPGSKSKEKTETNAVSDSEDHRVRHRPGQQPQRPMLAAQQIVCKIQTSEHVKARARDADSGDGVMVHAGEYCRGNARMIGISVRPVEGHRLQPCDLAAEHFEQEMKRLSVGTKVKALAAARASAETCGNDVKAVATAWLKKQGLIK